MFGFLLLFSLCIIILVLNGIYGTCLISDVCVCYARICASVCVYV